MKMTVFLLVSAMALLVNLSVASPTYQKPNGLRHIIQLAEKYNKSSPQEVFVESVNHLIDNGCGDKFFCKVYDILQKSANIPKGEDEDELLRSLKKFNDHGHVNCTVLLQEIKPTGEEIQIRQLMSHLISCAQRRHFSGGNKSNP